jgi:Fe-S-cluster containining protein
MADGFTCQRCGACCRVPGYVALEPGEAESIAAFLGLDVYAFTTQYTTLTFTRKELSLIEQEDGSCIFLQPDITCRIQPIKPGQCRGFPSQWKSPRLREACPGLREITARP